MPMHASDALQTSRTLYLDLRKRVLLNTIYDDPDQTITMWGRQYKAKDAWEEGGRTWLTPAHTTIGRKRLDNIALDACKQAVHDYLENNKVRAQIQQVDWSGIFWRKVQ
jgi:Macrocin-O-methyltransferase (TylF)